MISENLIKLSENLIKLLKNTLKFSIGFQNLLGMNKIDADLTGACHFLVYTKSITSIFNILNVSQYKAVRKVNKAYAFIEYFGILCYFN